MLSLGRGSPRTKAELNGTLIQKIRRRRLPSFGLQLHSVAVASLARSSPAKGGPEARQLDVRLRVECYSGRKADERPVRFYLGERLRIVEAILDQWYGPDSNFFKVRADDGNLYILRKSTASAEQEWTVESFRELKRM
jgi:hypothetical protein